MRAAIGGGDADGKCGTGDGDGSVGCGGGAESDWWDCNAGAPTGVCDEVARP